MARKNTEVKFFTKGSFDYIVLVVVLILLSLGLIMVLSASSATALSENGDGYRYFRKQAIAAGIGITRYACSFKS